ncbi:hypothetical protein [Anaerosacchariphilus polymeriproducens]|uniref:Protein Tlp homolog n=1 Tax=Anaerosacchariphilus polymeriproducens TaxID=1812858 RepID=A0A371ATH9_9FIRM|nr:hypothetical protein [Anaerosacchariphilus polymeriproducens]RDU22873.1 hypothetical protein DWV06_12435 [Anaerosacchariphilus polymeriproducens]
MNEIEKAIHVLKTNKETICDMISYNKNFEPKSDNARLEERKDALEIAIQALEEKKEREIK